MIAKIHKSPDPKPLYRVVHEGVALDYSSATPRETLYYTDDLGEANHFFEALVPSYKTPEYGEILIERCMTNTVRPRFTLVRKLRWNYKNRQWEQIMEK